MRVPSIVVLVTTVIALGAALTARAGVADTKHNLSASGPGMYTSSTEDRVCIFCHTPHNALGDAPLWNRDLTTATFQTYASNSMNAAPGQPSGDSKLCLTCHDGTIALNAVHVSGIAVITDLSSPISGQADLGVDLGDDHPVSFAYTSSLAASDGELADPSALPPAIHLQGDNLECTSCHDAHTSVQPMFLVTDKGALCTACHVKTGFPASSHDYVESDPVVDSDYACGNCHAPHRAGEPVRLTRKSEEQLCYDCHGTSSIGDPAIANAFPGGTDSVEYEMQDDGYGFFDSQSGTNRWVNAAHDVAPGQQSASGAHIECVNCHGVHMASADDLSTANVIESLVDPDDPSQPFTTTNSNGYGRSDPKWRKIYKLNTFCLKCHDGSMPSFTGARSHLSVNDPNPGSIINVSNTWGGDEHGRNKKNIPCMVCHDPHGGNPYLLARNIDFTGDQDFDTRRASSSLVLNGIVEPRNPIRFQLCGLTCHDGDKSSHQSNQTDCQSCHRHGNNF